MQPRSQAKHARLLLQHLAEEAPIPATCPRSVRRQLGGGRYYSFREFTSTIPEVIVDADPPGFTQVPAGLELRLLAPTVQQLMFNCIRMVDDVFKSGHSIDNLSECNIVICKSSFLPKLTRVTFSGRNKAGFEANMSSLAAIFRATLFTADTPPAEVERLLCRMEEGGAMQYRHLIRFHPCLVPIENRCEYFYRLHSFTVDVLQKDDCRRDHATVVFKNIVCCADWESKVRCNTYLRDYLNYSTYDPANIEDEPTRLHRNCVGHDLAYATSQCNEITRTDMARILYSVFSHLQLSLAEGLNCLDELHKLSLATLFSSHHLDEKTAYKIGFLTSSDED